MSKVIISSSSQVKTEDFLEDYSGRLSEGCSVRENTEVTGWLCNKLGTRLLHQDCPFVLPSWLCVAQGASAYAAVTCGPAREVAHMFSEIMCRQTRGRVNRPHEEMLEVGTTWLEAKSKYRPEEHSGELQHWNERWAGEGFPPHSYNITPNSPSAEKV